MTKQKIDVEGMLDTLASIRQQVPFLTEGHRTSQPVGMAGVEPLADGGEEAIEMFEMATLADALESFAGELSDSIEIALGEALAGALEIYYAAEELAKQPEHSHLIPYVQQMRESYRRDFGTDIPQRGE